MKRIFHRLLCWMLVLAIAGLPALAAAAGMGDGHAGHAMHGVQSKTSDEPADHATRDHHNHHGHGDDHDYHAHDDHGGHIGAHHGGGHAYENPGFSLVSDRVVHADCADGACLGSCSACSHCQGMPSMAGMHLLPPVVQAVSLSTFQSGPPVAALFRPPILS